MNVSIFFNSYAGMYVAQSFCHAVLAAVIADRAMKAWKIYDPLVRQRFRLIVILFPIFSFPFYQLINPDRSSAQFRLNALFDVNRWLNLEIWGILPIGLFVLIMLACTTLVFLFQEMIPILKHTLKSRPAEQEGTRRGPDPFVESASKALSIEPPEVLFIDDEEPVLFSTAGKEPAIYISTGLAAQLKEDQMQAALAHEIAHIARNKRPLLMVVFILRVLMFFNPAVLIKFRRAVRDEEKICDDIAVSLTQNPAALAGALERFYHRPEEVLGLDRQKLPAFANSLEEYNHNLHLESRITRLKQASTEREQLGGMVPFTATLTVIAVLNYFVV